MARAQRLFRYVWRINAILILVATAGICLLAGTTLISLLGAGSSRRERAEAAPAVGTADAGERLFLSDVRLVPGTSVFRGELMVYRSGRGFSSGYGGDREIRNLLFIEDQSKEGRWLLPDHDHILTNHIDVGGPHDKCTDAPTVATVALVKTTQADALAAEGTLLLFNPSGSKVQTVAEGVRAIHSATLEHGAILVLFERHRKYAMAAFDPASLAKTDQHEIEVPQLK